MEENLKVSPCDLYRRKAVERKSFVPHTHTHTHETDIWKRISTHLLAKKIPFDEELGSSSAKGSASWKSKITTTAAALHLLVSKQLRAGERERGGGGGGREREV
jgi:hypothetical protein